MGVEVVLYEDDFLGVKEMGVHQVFQDMGIIDGRAPLGDLDVSPPFERREQHE